MPQRTSVPYRPEKSDRKSGDGLFGMSVVILLLIIVWWLTGPFVRMLTPFGISLGIFPYDLPYGSGIIIIVLIIYIILRFGRAKPNGSEKNVRFTFSRKTGMLFVSAIIFLLCMLYFTSKSLIGTEVITRYDYAFHYYYAWYTDYYLLPEFGSIYGFSNYYYAGHPILWFYPPGVYIVQYFLHYIGLSIPIIFRIFIAISFMGYLSIPFIIRKKKKSETLNGNVYGPGCMGLVFLLILYYWAIPFGQGMYVFPLSIVFAVFLIYDFENTKRNLFKKRFRMLPFDKKVILHSSLIAIISFLHFASVFTVVGYIIFSSGVYWSSESLKHRKRGENFGHALYVTLRREPGIITVPLIYTVMALLLISYYLIPNLGITARYFLPNSGQKIFGFLMFVVCESLTFTVFITMPPFIYYLIYRATSRYYNNGKKRKSGSLLFFPADGSFVPLAFSFILVIFMITAGILSATFLPVINNLGPTRWLMFVYPIWAVELGNLIYKQFFGKTVRRPKISGIFRKTVIFAVPVLLLWTAVYSYFNVLYPAVGESDEYTPLKIVNRTRENFTELPENVSEVFTFIGTLGSPNYRILVEESGFGSGFKWGGYTLALLAPYYNQSFIGGYYHIFGMYYDKAFSATAYEGYIFYTGLAGNLSEEENSVYLNGIALKLKLLNIKYLVLWSKNASEFFMRNNRTFELIKRIDNFRVFRFLNAVDSYVLLNFERPIIRNFTMLQNHVSFEIFNCKRGNTIRVSLQNFPNWKITLNGTPVTARPSENLITIDVPADGNYIVEIDWVSSPYEFYGTMITAVGAAFIPVSGLISSVSYKKKGKIGSM